MRLLTLFYVAVVMTVTGSRAGAQTAVSPTPRLTPPSGPLLNAAPAFSAWTIVQQSIPGLEVQPLEAVVKAAAAATKPDSVTSVTKTGLVRHLARTSDTHVQEDVWYENGNRITMQSMWKIPMFERAVSAPSQPVGPDFPEFAWISPEKFVGTQEKQGAAYFVFESEVTAGDARSAKSYGYKLATKFSRAYVNADNRLPWLLQTGNVLQRYAFQTPPTAMLDVPAAYQAMFDTYEKNKVLATRRPVAP